MATLSETPIVETADISLPGPITLDAVTLTGDPASPYASGARQEWDLAGFDVTCAADSTQQMIVLRGIKVTNSGSSVTPFTTSLLVLMDSDIRSLTSGTRVFAAVSSGQVYARNSFFDSPIFSGKALLVDSEIAFGLNGSYTMTSSSFYWFGGNLDILNSGPASDTVTIGGTSQTAVIRDVTYNADLSDATSGITHTLAITNTGSNVIEFLNATGMTLTVAAGCGATVVEGEYAAVTMNAPSTASRTRRFIGTVGGASTWNGPGVYDIKATAGVQTFGGTRVRANIHAGSNTASPVLDLVGCDDSLITASISGTGKAYAIDANSDRSILIIAGSNNTFGTASTNASATSIVIDESLAVAASYTDEEAQDAVGAMIADTATIDLTYTDATPELKADVIDGSITATKLDATTVAELIRDTIGSALVQGTGITITVNDAGDTITIAASGAAVADIQVFNAGTGQTWNKPSGAKFVFMQAVGAGGGGGSGRKAATGTNRYGGSGGDAGAYAEVWYQASDLGSSLTVNVGTGGTGGAAQTGVATDGNAGAAGSAVSQVLDSSLNRIRADVGAGGLGGSSTVATASAGTTADYPDGNGMFGGVGGGGASNGVGGASLRGSALLGTPYSSGPGGGGGGSDTSNNARTPGTGGAIPLWLGNSTGGAAGTTGASPTAGGVGVARSTVLSTGGGGGGGSTVAGTAGAAGGDGVGAGAGGGGGGCGTGTGDSGAGGNGGDGVVVITTYF